MSQQTARPDSIDYDNCLRVGTKHREKLSDSELLAISVVAMAYLSKSSVSNTELDNVRRIVQRFQNQEAI